MEKAALLIQQGDRRRNVLRVAEAVKGLKGVHPAVEALLIHKPNQDVLDRIHRHMPLLPVFGEEVAVEGGLHVAAVPVDHCQIQNQRLDLPEVF